jgi:hypothetical protein
MGSDAASQSLGCSEVDFGPLGGRGHRSSKGGVGFVFGHPVAQSKGMDMRHWRAAGWVTNSKAMVSNDVPVSEQHEGLYISRFGNPDIPSFDILHVGADGCQRDFFLEQWLVASESRIKDVGWI